MSTSRPVPTFRPTLAALLITAALPFISSSEASAGVIFADANDGFLEVRDVLPPSAPWPQVHPDTFGNFRIQVGEWFGPGLTTGVLPFQLPDLGAVVDPFTSADLGVMLFQIGDNTVTDVDLYGVRVDADPAIVPGDFYVGSAIDPTATLIQESFLTPASSAGFVGAPNNNTDATGDANLLAFLNDSYADGANAGQYVFLRLSYAGATFATGFDAYLITAREAGQEGEWPVINFTAVPEPATAAALASLMVLAGRRRRNAGSARR